MRKDLGLSINDEAKVIIGSSDDFIKDVLSKFNEDIKRETLSSGIIPGEVSEGEGRNVKIDDKELVILLVKNN